MLHQRAWENACVMEVIRAQVPAAQAKVAIFDFDGTLSVIRSGWVDIMVPMCVEQLVALDTGEPVDELRAVVEEFVGRLTGKETIYQMMALADAVRERGGQPLEPLAYKQMYLACLSEHIRSRLEDLQEKRKPADFYTVPGARVFLEALRDRGLTLYLASGTDDADVKREADLLDLSQYFEDRIFGAQDDLKRFSKAMLVQKIVSQASFLSPEELIVFGDGYVEIEEVKKVGGLAVGLATAEPECKQIDTRKRRRLLQAGADVIVANYANTVELLEWVFSAPQMLQENAASALV